MRSKPESSDMGPTTTTGKLEHGAGDSGAATAAFDHDLNDNSHLQLRRESTARSTSRSKDRDPASSLDVPFDNADYTSGLRGRRTPSRSRSPLVFREARRPTSLQKGTVLERARESVHAFWARNKGVVFVTIAQLFNVLMNVAARVLEREGNHGKGLHPIQILFARMSITFALSTLYMWYQQTPYFPFGMKEVRWLLCLRSFGGFFGIFGMYYSLLYLPLSDATVITFLAPSLSCWACSLLLAEPFTRIEQVGAYISIVGVVLIARPTSLFSSSTPSPASPGSPADSLAAPEPSPPHSLDDVTPGQRALAVGVALTGVLGAACAYTTIRWIGKRAHPLISVNYYAAWSTLVCVAIMLLLPSIGFVLPATVKEWSYLLFLGVCGFTMQFLLAAGLQHEKGSRATNMVYTQMLFALGCDQLVFGVSPGWVSLGGSSLILGSAVYVAVYKEKEKKRGGVVGSGVVGADEERGLVEGMDDGEEEDGREVELRDLGGR